MWAASDEAQFLHGRFVSAPWDVNELATGEARKNIDSGVDYLRLIIGGLEVVEKGNGLSELMVAWRSFERWKFGVGKVRLPSHYITYPNRISWCAIIKEAIRVLAATRLCRCARPRGVNATRLF